MKANLEFKNFKFYDDFAKTRLPAAWWVFSFKISFMYQS